HAPQRHRALPALQAAAGDAGARRVAHAVRLRARVRRPDDRRHRARGHRHQSRPGVVGGPPRPASLRPSRPARLKEPPRTVITPEAILAALGTVNDPDLHRDLVTLGMIEDVAVDSGAVVFTLVLATSAAPWRAQLEDDCRRAVLRVPGVTDVQIRTTSRVRKPKDPSADRKALPGVGPVIAIGSGKGGVGKSTVAANLAIALAQT